MKGTGAVVALGLAAAAVAGMAWWPGGGGAPAAGVEPAGARGHSRPQELVGGYASPPRAEPFFPSSPEPEAASRSEPRPSFEAHHLGGIELQARSFDPVAFRAVAARLLALGEEEALERLRELEREERAGEHSLHVAALIAFLWSGDRESMPLYMLAGGARHVVPRLRETFPSFPILEHDGIPFFLDDLALLGRPSRRGGSFGKSGEGFVEWAGGGSLRASLPQPLGDPLAAAGELAAVVQGLMLVRGGQPADGLVQSLREQAWRCLGPRARASAMRELDLDPGAGAWWSEDAWWKLRDWLGRRSAGWDRAGRYELEAD